MVKLELATLESWLWDLANILRGSIEKEEETVMERDGIGWEKAEDKIFLKIST